MVASGFSWELTEPFCGLNDRLAGGFGEVIIQPGALFTVQIGGLDGSRAVVSRKESLAQGEHLGTMAKLGGRLGHGAVC